MVAAGPAFSTIEPLGKHHDRASFSCGEPALDGYLKHQASQDMRRRVAAVFVLVGSEPHTVAGYYSLSAHAVDIDVIPPEVGRKLPRYPHMPATLLGRLARDLGYRGTGAGEFLLLDACAARSLAAESSRRLPWSSTRRTSGRNAFIPASGSNPSSAPGRGCFSRSARSRS